VTGSAGRVLVTRPRAQAPAWVEALVSHGVDAVAVPLIGIGPAPDAAAVRAAWQTLGARRLVMFVSASAVQAWFAAAPAGVRWPSTVRAAATGPGTVAALRACGVPAESIDAPPEDAQRFDSEALWSRLAARDWGGARVLVVRGDGGRDWLAERLTERGANVESVAAYRRTAPVLDAAERGRLRAALDAPSAHVWLFGSSEAIAHLGTVVAVEALSLPPPWPASCAVATHPRIAESARRIGFGRVHEARATVPDVVACIQSIRP